MNWLDKDCGANPFRDLKTICLIFILNEFLNGLPAQTLISGLLGGIKVAVCYNFSSTVLEILQMINFH